MPGLITHLLSGQQTLTHLPKPITKIIKTHRPLYNTGCQGPDIFFYYIAGHIRKHLRGIGNKMHQSASGDFIKAMVTLIKKLGGTDKDTNFAYFAGWLTHYMLDATAHPYIYYKTGFSKDGKLCGKYNVYHVTFESAIDTLLLDRLWGKRPSDIRWWRTLARRGKDVRSTARTLSKAVSYSYATPLTPSQTASAMASISTASMVLRSPRGHLRRAISFFEDLVLPSYIATPLIHHDDISKHLDYLNLQHNSWKNPWDKSSNRTESFIDLFDRSALEAASLITSLHGYLYGDLPLATFLKKAGNRSFNSGCPLHEDIIFTTYDIIFK